MSAGLDHAAAGFRYRFRVISTSRPPRETNDAAVTLNLLAGRDDHLIYCGTLTMSEPEWFNLKQALTGVSGEAFEFEDRA